ncbi:MAG TPA: phosphatidylglycerophosphatase A [Bacteroidota bacterium]|nr:phosphatidylglycerophosphatase A [Bacteroidota bacterium]
MNLHVQPDSSSKPSLPVRLIATGLFSGYIPFAPGTAGSLLGLAVYLIPNFEQPMLSSIAILVFLFAGTGVSGIMERAYGKDPSIVVIDEVVGMWIALFLLPKSAAACIIAFVLFRIFDIIKPPPARTMESLPGGWGIMLDDVAAAIYANLLTRVLLLFAPHA